MKTSGDVYFDQFWEAYPKRVKKVLALREWKKLFGRYRSMDFTIKDILSGVESWKQSAQWQDIQFVPDPERFLKYRRWEDEVPQAKPSHLTVGDGGFQNVKVRPEILERERQRQMRRGQ